MKKIIFIIFILLTLFFFTSCSYDIPQGAQKDHYTYEEIVEFAKDIDPSAVVYETYTDIHLENMMRNKYREWDAVIFVINCHVASVPVLVWNTGIAAGEFAKQYFFIDTDYDYYLLKSIVTNNYPNWNICDDDFNIRYSTSTALKKYYTIRPKNLEKRKLSYDELEEIWSIANDIYNEYEKTSICKNLYFQVYRPSVYTTATGEEKVVRINLKSYYIKDKLNDELYQKYEKEWELINSGLPVE